MKNKNIKVVLVMLCLCALAASACSAGGGRGKDAGEKVQKETKEIVTQNVKEPEYDWVEDVLGQMTLEEKAAQLFVITPEALTGTGQAVQAGETTRKCLKEYPVGGLIYFTSNIESREQIQEMLENSKNYMLENSQIPLFVSVDEEGGTVARVADSGIAGIPKLGNMSEIGASGDSRKAYETGLTLGKYLSELGFNLDFAPVADVLTNPDNTVVRYRSFGGDKELVSEMVLKELDGLHKSGMLGVVKHFPGHGATLGDTHEGYAYTDKTLDEMLENEMVPFQKAIENNVQIVMAGHISVPGITGNEEPASLSHTVITDILRERLGFDGIVITDALNMGAVAEMYTSSEAAVKVLEAGGDMLLMPEDFQSAYQGVLDAVSSGRIEEERLDESVRRILRVKEKLKDAEI